MALERGTLLSLKGMLIHNLLPFSSMLTAKSFTNTGYEIFKNDICLVWNSVSGGMWQWGIHEALSATGAKDPFCPIKVYSVEGYG